MTTVPTDSAARSWWSDSSQRSVGFSTIGTVTGISTFYTKQDVMVVIPQATNFTDHGTQCAGQVFGKNYGSAYNCNKWVMNGIGSYSAGINDNVNLIFKNYFIYTNPTGIDTLQQLLNKMIQKPTLSRKVVIDLLLGMKLLLLL